MKEFKASSRLRCLPLERTFWPVHIIVLVIEQYKKRNVKNDPCKAFIQRAVSTLSKRPDWFETIGEFALPGDAQSVERQRKGRAA